MPYESYCIRNYVIDASKENGYYLLYNSEMPTIPRLSHYSPLLYYEEKLKLVVYIYILLTMMIIPISSLVAYHCQRGAMEGITPLTRSLPVTFNDEAYTSLLVPPYDEDDVNDLPEYN